MNIHEKAKEILQKEFEQSPVIGSEMLWNGVIHKDYRGQFERFKSIDSFNAWGYESVNPLYDQSIRVFDWFSHEVIIPFIKDNYIHARKLKRNEVQNTSTPRLALLSQQGETLYASAYSGEQNLALILNRRNIDLESRAQQLALSSSYRKMWSLELELHEKWGDLPSFHDIANLYSGNLFDAAYEVERWNDEVNILTNSGLNPCWLTTLYFFVKKGMIGNLEIKEKLEQFFESSRQFREMEMHNKEKRDPEDLYIIAYSLGRALKRASDRGFILYEVAPRDMVIGHDLTVRFADTEKVECFSRPLTENERKKQFSLLKREFPRYRESKVQDKSRFLYSLFMQEVKMEYFS